MRKKIYILTLALTIFSFQLMLAQGYEGKRFILKVDLAAPIIQKGIIGDIDYVVSRNISVSAFFNMSNKAHTQRLPDYFDTYRAFPSKKANIKDIQGGLRLKLYIGDSPPAPIGIYLFGSYAQGVGTANGDYYDEFKDELIPYEITGIRTQQASLGIGTENVIFDLFTIDFDCGITTGITNLPDEEVSRDHLVSYQSYSDQYGPNLYSLGEFMQNNGFGLSLHIKLGVLLF